MFYNMAASMARQMFLRKIRTVFSYSALSSLHCRHKQLLHEAAAARLPQAVYETDSEGNVIAPAPRPLPSGLDLDPEVQARCEDDPLRYPKSHPGLVTPKKPPDLPKRLVNNARRILAEEDLINNSNFEHEVKHLKEVYLRRKLPQDETLRQQRLQTIAEELSREECERMGKEPGDLTEEQLKRLQQKVEVVSRKILHRTTHNYKPIDFNNSHVGLVFLAARTTANFTVLHRVFQEIKQLDVGFTPAAVLNVGSGTGSAIWAADAVWKDKVSEYYNVDTSNHMNDLARKLLAYDILDPANLSIRGAHFRQFIPSAKHEQNQFPLVVSAYLLMEQPLLAERLETLSHLWELTQHYMVLVEHGTNAGYQLLQEARHVILQMGKEDEEFGGHVVAPCTHDEVCPKLQLQKSPCNFPLKYRLLNIRTDYGQGDVICTEKFSYVVFKKGPRPDGEQYPRVTGVLHKSSHSHCQMCCPDGSLRHFVITKTKPSVHMFRCTKRCNKGDLLPVKWPSSKTMQQTQTVLDDNSGIDVNTVYSSDKTVPENTDSVLENQNDDETLEK